MYHLYNLIEVGDLVRGPTVRRVQSESSTGSIESQRVRVTLTIQVAKSSFDATGSSAPPDPAAEGSSAGAVSGAITDVSSSSSTAGALGGGSGGDGATLHVSGRVVSENKHVKMGAFHTLDLEVNRQLTIIKDSWDSIHFERLNESSDVGQRAEVGAVVLGDGESNFRCPEEVDYVARKREGGLGRVEGREAKREAREKTKRERERGKKECDC